MTTADLLAYANTLYAPSLLDAELVSTSQERVVLRSPASSHQNDKGSAFAGSLYSLCDLAGLLLCSQQADPQFYRTQLIQGDIHYLSAVRDDLVLEVTLKEPVDMSAVDAGEARTAVVSGQFIENNKVAAIFTGTFSISLLPNA